MKIATQFPEKVSMCRQCHKTCLGNQNCSSGHNNTNFIHDRDSENNVKNNEKEDNWRSFVMMGFSVMNPVAHMVGLDPFAAPPPVISVVPPTPEMSHRCSNRSDFNYDTENQVDDIMCNNDTTVTPDDSPLTEDQPYHSLSSSNLTIRRFGTVSSLERIGTEEEESEEGDADTEEEEDIDEEKEMLNEAYNNSSIRSWTARAGSYVAEKMSFFDRFGDDYKGGFFER